MPYTRYPTVQEMVGIFQGMRAQLLTEELNRNRLDLEKRAQLLTEKLNKKRLNLEKKAQLITKEFNRTRLDLEKKDQDRQAKRDKFLTRNTRRQLRLNQQEFELRQQEAADLAEYRRSSLLNAQRNATMDYERQKAASISNLLGFGKNYRDLAFDQLKEGESEDPDAYAEFMQSMSTVGSMMGIRPEGLGQMLGVFQPLKKPDIEATVGQKFSLVPSLIAAGATQAATKILSDEGVDVDLTKIDKDEDWDTAQNRAFSEALTLLSKGQIKPEDFSSIVEGISEGRLTDIVETDITQPKRQMSHSDIAAARENARILGLDPREATAKAMAEKKTRDTGVPHVAIKPKKKWAEDKWIVVPETEAKDKYGIETTSGGFDF